MPMMRDSFIDGVYDLMRKRSDIFFLSADFGSPSLDKIRYDFPEKFFNVGIAEQDLIGIAAGLALEGFIVYAYAIASFLSMRAFEQIRVNLSLMGQIKPMNVNLVSVGAGVSYDIAGATHHCLEDISLMRLLPHIELFSPSDSILAGEFVKHSSSTGIKYLRLDGKSLEDIYVNNKPDFDDGFSCLRSGSSLCIVATGYMTHTALKVADLLKTGGVACSVIDIFLLKKFKSKKLADFLKPYKHIFTIEEGFTGVGGLDACVMALMPRGAYFKNFGFSANYCFASGTRDFLHKQVGLHPLTIADQIKKYLK
jgi:transketolase